MVFEFDKIFGAELAGALSLGLSFSLSFFNQDTLNPYLSYSFVSLRPWQFHQKENVLDKKILIDDDLFMPK